MKKQIFVWAILSLFATSVFGQKLPKITKKGVVHLADGTKQKIEGWNDPNTSVFFIIRHAEKDTIKGSKTYDDLTEKGHKRAAKLAKMLQKLPISTVSSTDRSRTKNTALPTANSHKCTLALYDAKKQNDYLTKLAEINGKKHLIVGHSNTVPQMLNFLTNSATYIDVPDNEYTRLYIVSYSKTGKKSVILLNY